MNVFWGIADKISEWVRWAFEGIYPVINSFWNMLYSTALNPFETPNGFTALLLQLSIGFVVLFGFAHLIKNVSQYTQKKMLKKIVVIVMSIILLILMSRLVSENEKEITFNTSLIYIKSNVQINPEDKNPNITTDSLGYTTISGNNAFSEDPFAGDTAVVADGSNKRSSLVFFPSQAFGIRNSIKYTQNFGLAVGIHPISASYSEVAKNGVFLSQHDIVGKSLPNGVQASSDICSTNSSGQSDPATGAGGVSDPLKAFGNILDLENKDNRVQEAKKMMDSSNGYKSVACIDNITVNRKDIIFYNEADSAKKSTYEVVSFYYPLVILANLGSIDISQDIQSYKADFLFGAAAANTAATGSGATTEATANSGASPEDKVRNETYSNILKEIQNSGYLDRGDGDNSSARLNTLTAYNVSKKEADVFNTSKLKAHLSGQVGLIAENLKKIAEFEQTLQNPQATTNLEYVRGQIDTLNKQNTAIYGPLVDANAHLISVFSTGDAISLNELNTASTETKAIKIASMVNSLSQTSDDIFTDKEKRFIDLYKKVEEFVAKYPSAASAGSANKTFSSVMETFVGQQSTLGKNLMTGGDMVIKLLCGNDENLKKINNGLKNFGASEFSEDVVKCANGTGNILDREKLVDILNSVVSLQNKKDKLTYVNLVSYYGKIFKNTSSTNSKLGTVVDTKYESTLPVKIGNFTLISPLYYYNKLINDDVSGLPPFINLKNIDGKVYMPDGVYDMKIWGIVSWYKDLDEEKGHEYSNTLSVFGLPLIGTILVGILFLVNLALVAGAFLFVISFFLILIKD